jgi:hypothetical protein
MQPTTQSASKKGLWTGYILTALIVLFMLFDSGLKILRLAPAMDANARLGYPESVILPIGITELICVILFIIPRTSILGAILLTGYLGGATASQVRLQDPWFFFPIVIGILAWGGLFLRDPRLRPLIPATSMQSLGSSLPNASPRT